MKPISIRPEVDLPPVVFASSDLLENQKGLRFALPQLGEFATGFVIRHNGKAHAYVNQCAHVPVELDWAHGEFFTTDKRYLICATHGAHYEPSTGFCVMGPCKGQSLREIPLVETDGQIAIQISAIYAYNRF